MGQVDILFWRGFTNWFTKFDAEGALHLFFNSFEVSIGFLVNQSTCGSIIKKRSLVLIPYFCAILGEQLPVRSKRSFMVC